jgi:hypothetical protein
MQWRTSRLLNRLPRLASARAGSTNVLTDFPAASGEADQITYFDHSRFRLATELLSRQATFRPSVLQNRTL